MTNEMSKDDTNKILFANLIMMLSSTAMQQMGKIINPMTNKAEMDLVGAQMTVDIISMLQAKTKDHCDENETKMVSDILSSLQMNFVETSQSAAADKPEAKDEEEEKSDAEPEE